MATKLRSAIKKSLGVTFSSRGFTKAKDDLYVLSPASDARLHGALRLSVEPDNYGAMRLSGFASTWDPNVNAFLKEVPDDALDNLTKMRRTEMWQLWGASFRTLASNSATGPLEWIADTDEEALTAVEELTAFFDANVSSWFEEFTAPEASVSAALNFTAGANPHFVRSHTARFTLLGQNDRCAQALRAWRETLPNSNDSIEAVDRFEEWLQSAQP